MPLLKSIFRLVLLPPLYKYVEKSKWPNSINQLKRDRKSLKIVTKINNKLHNYKPLKLEIIALSKIKLYRYLMHDEPKEKQKYILYFHGGGFCFNSPETYKFIFYQFCKRTDCIIYIPRYRLSPEVCFPGSLNDCMESYNYLINELKLDPAKIIVAGDSAGGNLAIAMCYKLALKGSPGLPAGILSFSPWLDLSLKGPSYQFNSGKDKLLPYESIKRAVWLYVKGNFNYNQFDDSTQDKFKEVCLEKGMPYVYGNEAEKYQKKLQSSLISPVYMKAGLWMNSFPKMLIHCAAEEFLLSDSLIFARKLNTYISNTKIKEQSYNTPTQTFDELGRLSTSDIARLKNSTNIYPEGCNTLEDESLPAQLCVWKDEIHAFPVFGKLAYPNAKACLKISADWINNLLA